MKKITLSLVSVLALSSFAFAGSEDSSSLYMPGKSAIYVGLGYGSFKQSTTGIDYPAAKSFTLEADTVMLQGGYKYNPYFSLEARYWMGVSKIDQDGGESPDKYSGDINSFGIYLKPNIPLSDTGINIYALFGYGNTSVKYSGGNKWDTDGYSWGYGVEYEAMDNLGIFIDYVKVGSADSFDYTDRDGVDADIDVETINFGLNYKFQL